MKLFLSPDSMELVSIITRVGSFFPVWEGVVLGLDLLAISTNRFVSLTTMVAEASDVTGFLGIRSTVIWSLTAAGRLQQLWQNPWCKHKNKKVQNIYIVTSFCFIVIFALVLSRKNQYRIMNDNNENFEEQTKNPYF